MTLKKDKKIFLIQFFSFTIVENGVATFCIGFVKDIELMKAKYMAVTNGSEESKKGLTVNCGD